MSKMHDKSFQELIFAEQMQHKTDNPTFENWVK